MDVDKMEKHLKDLEEGASTDEERDRLFELQKVYHGDDEVITANDFKDGAEKEEVLYAVGSGIHGLDKIIGGFRPGNLIMISGPTKQGKTTLCQTLTHNFTKQGFKCLWFSFDTPSIELIERFNDNLPVFYLPRRNLGDKKIEWIEKKIVEGLAKFETKIIFIDHLGFLSKYTDRAQNYATELTSIVRELKEIALRWNVTIFLNHHIRGIDADVIPNYSHLKDSSGPAQDSDITIMVWREREKGPYGVVFTDYSYVSVQLHRRTGKTGNVKCKFNNNLLSDAEHENRESEF